MAPLILRSAPLFGSGFLFDPHPSVANRQADFDFADFRLTPHYPAKSPLAEVLALVTPGSDEYLSEKYAFEIGAILAQWSEALKQSLLDLSILENSLDVSLQAPSLATARETQVRSGYGIDVVKREFAADLFQGRPRFISAMKEWLKQIAQIETAEFDIIKIEEIASPAHALRTQIRFDLVGGRKDQRREERVGLWTIEWSQPESGSWKVKKWEVGEETLCIANGPGFIDVTAQALGRTDSYKNQLLHGVDYWRSVLDGACGIDVYGNNGIAAGDFDGDGYDDLYVCQPSGLPNRLYRNLGDGTFEDVTEKAGVGVLDGTACALFADFDNRGHQDLLVVCGIGPLLFRNHGDGTFSLKPDAFRFERPPLGAFTHAALADYDRDGRLDVYFCTYSYYLGLDQYHYPVPYFDARNGPANFLLHNEGNGRFADRTEAAGLNVDNDRYSFACAWGEAQSNGLPDLFVANDFGRANLYRNNGDGTFTSVSSEAHVEDAGAGMSACWGDFDNDGRQDIYIANMWSAAGQRVSEQKIFHANAPAEIRELYQRHSSGNALYRNERNGNFQNVGESSGVAMGRWSWSSDFIDFDHDGFPDLYVANGYISAPKHDALNQNDLSSFFWRQVVAKSPEDATPSLVYEHGWNALNELIRSDHSWNSYERNVLFANNRNGTFSEVSGALGLDFPEDSRSFVLADLDHDGRLEIVLKNRNAPQLRILHNSMKEIGRSISFRLQGQKSNRDAIGTAITIEVGSLRQTKYLQAGSGFLAQHTKEVFFGIGKAEAAIKAIVRWPSGLTQVFEKLQANHRIELVEGSSVFNASPLAASTAYQNASKPSPPEKLPSQTETWLVEPLKAPEFSLLDLASNIKGLRETQGAFVFLNFWTIAVPACPDQLRILHQHRLALDAGDLKILAVNVDGGEQLPAARSFAAKEAFAFPVLFATEEVAGIYNIIYRYLFDRRRDLPIPASFLLDKQGMIVKVYQGTVDPKRLLEDVHSLPTNEGERSKRAIPFDGVLYQGSFARNDFTYGIAMFQHGYLDQAAESFRQVIAAKPKDPEGYYNLGTLSLRKNDLVQARQYLEQAVKLRPDYPEAWNNLGMIAAQEGHPAEAIDNFQRSLKLRPTYAIALLNLGNVYRRQGSYREAEQSLRRALELQPEDAEISYTIGMLYAQQSQMRSAVEYLQKAILLKNDYPEALNNLGIVFVREQEFARAEDEFIICIRAAPNFDQAYLNLARLYAMRSDKEKAKKVLNDLLRLQPDNSGAKQFLGMLQSGP